MIHNIPNVQGIRRKVERLFRDEFGMGNGNGGNDIKEFIYVYKDVQI